MYGLSESTTAGNYLTFAAHHARGSSETLEIWSTGVGNDAEILGLLDALPAPKRQPNLLFAAARLVAGEHELPAGTAYDQFREAVVSRWSEIRRQMMARATQTNEAGRCATLLPVLAEVPGPIALLEVGASAGLCLYPDLYSYQYWVDGGAEPEVAPILRESRVLNRCQVTSLDVVPQRLPEVAWRGGIDLNPLDPGDPDTRAWLDALVWPEHRERRKRLDAALQVAAANPIDIVRGSLLEEVLPLASQVPRDLTLVVFHTAVLAYLSPSEREQFAAMMSQLREDRPGTLWLSNEGPDVLGSAGPQLENEQRAQASSRFVLALNGQALALTGQHGESFEPL